MAVVATGQITIIDYNDALSLTGYISSNKPKTQMYNSDNGTYNPDWAASNVVLTPSLFILGTATDIIATAAVTSITWYDVSAGTEVLLTNDVNYAIGASGAKALTIKTNRLAGLPGKDFMCKVIYHDASTNLDLTLKIPISFSRVINGSGITDAVAWLLDGAVFKNGTVATLRAQCDLWRGSLPDTTLVLYQWYKLVAGNPDEGAGAGWDTCANAANVLAGVTTNVLTIYPAAVLGYGVFKCKVTDNDPTSPTYNTAFWDTVTVADQSDPVQCTVTSSGGEVFKNGVGSSTLTAKLYRAGAEIDVAGTTYTYKWYKYDSAGVKVLLWGGAVDYKTGKTLAIGDADVLVKNTFIVEVE